MVEKTKLHFYKFISGVKQLTADNFVHGELGRWPCQFRFTSKQVESWKRLIGLTKRRLAYEALQAVFRP